MSVENEQKLIQYYDSAVTQYITPAKFRAALIRIHPFRRQLLALWMYVSRVRGFIEANWAWDQAHFRSWRRSSGLDGQINLVKLEFERRNTGFTIEPKTFRTFESQLNNWNGNGPTNNVGQLSDLLYSDCFGFVQGLPDIPTREAIRDFREHLRRNPFPGRNTQPSIAAPGLSDHGHGNAVDFEIKRTSGVTEAPIVTSSAVYNWGTRDSGGWRDKLQIAVRESSSRFVGPLEIEGLYEPWHYTLPDLPQVATT